jgi:hypothetical protein
MSTSAHIDVVVNTVRTNFMFDRELGRITSGNSLRLNNRRKKYERRLV